MCACGHARGRRRWAGVRVGCRSSSLGRRTRGRRLVRQRCAAATWVGYAISDAWFLVSRTVGKDRERLVRHSRGFRRWPCLASAWVREERGGGEPSSSRPVGSGWYGDVSAWMPPPRPSLLRAAVVRGEESKGRRQRQGRWALNIDAERGQKKAGSWSKWVPRGAVRCGAVRCGCRQVWESGGCGSGCGWVVWTGVYRLLLVLASPKSVSGGACRLRGAKSGKIGGCCWVAAAVPHSSSQLNSRAEGMEGRGSGCGGSSCLGRAGKQDWSLQSRRATWIAWVLVVAELGEVLISTARKHEAGEASITPNEIDARPC